MDSYGFPQTKITLPETNNSDDGWLGDERFPFGSFGLFLDASC